MIKKQYFIIVLALLFIMPLVMAETTTLGTFKQNQCIDLIQTCSNCSYVNISSVLYPNSSKALAEVIMTKEGTYYNYTFCDTNHLGEYIVNGYGDLDGKLTIWSYDFRINKYGDSLNEADSNITSSSIYFILALSITFLILGWSLIGRNFWVSWVGLFLMVFGFIFIYYDLTMVNLYMNTLNITSSAPTGLFLFFARFIKILPYITALIIAFSIVKLLKNITKKNNSRDGWDNNLY